MQSLDSQVYRMISSSLSDDFWQLMDPWTLCRSVVAAVWPIFDTDGSGEIGVRPCALPPRLFSHYSPTPRNADDQDVSSWLVRVCARTHIHIYSTSMVQ